MDDYHPVPLTITEKQFRRLRNNHQVQLKHHQIAHGTKHRHHVVVHHTKAKKIHHAAKHNKGVRLGLSKHEMEMSGQGFAEFIQGLKKAGSWIKNNILDSNIYQQTVKPIVHGLVDQGINAASTLVGSKTGPAGQQLANDLGHAAANKFYDASGVGLHHRRRHGGQLRGGYRQGQYGHGSTQGEVDMSSRQIKNTWPASEFTPLLPPSKYPSLIQHAEQAQGSGMRKTHRRRGRPGRGGSFRLN
jgi:hypothetical protein